MDNPSLSSSPSGKSNVFEKISRFFLTRIVIGFLFILMTSKLLWLLLSNFFGFVNLRIIEPTRLSVQIANMETFIGNIILCLGIISFYCFYCCFFEKRPGKEFSKLGALKESILGYLIGTSLIFLIVLCLYLFNCYSLLGIRIISLTAAFSIFLTVAFIEEVLFRGIIFRITEEKLGSILALILSALIFGFAHSFNPNASFWSSLFIAIAGGSLLTSAYIVTRRLWFPVFIHLGWNFTLGNIVGASVSGMKIPDSIMQSKISGPVYLTGGDFGPEGSVITIILCLIIAAVFLYLAYKKGNFIRPFWKKRLLKSPIN